MAENELLDVAGGKRWTETRQNLRAGLDPDVIANQALDDLNRGLRRTLVSAQKKSDSLQSLIRASERSKEDERDAIERFPDRTLARIVIAAFKKLPGCKEPRILVNTVTSLLIDKVRDAIMGHAGESTRYQASVERHLLGFALSTALDRFRPDLRSIILTSLAGFPVKAILRPRTTEASKKLRVKTVLEQSLVPVAVQVNHAERRH